MPRQKPLSFAFWAAASVAHAQSEANDTVYEPEANFAPMAKNDREVMSNTLNPMASGNELPVLVPLRPMQTTVSLTPMVAPVSETAVSLTAMVTPTNVEPIILRPMQTASQPNPSPTMLVSMGGTKPMVMRSGLSRGVAVPVEGLAGLAPLPVPSRATGKSINVGTGPAIRQVVSPDNFTATGGLVNEEGTSPGQNPLPLAPLGIAAFIDNDLPPDPSIPTTQRPEDQMLAVDVTVNKIMRSKLLNVYVADDGNLWLPLTDLAQLLEIAIRINAGAGVVNGWYLKPSNVVSLSMKDNKATIGPQTFPAATRLEKQATDIYITAAALKEWFNIDARLDYNDLRLYLTTPNPLPGDVQAKRYESWEKSNQARERNRMPSDTIVPGYADFSDPSFRVGVNTSVASSPNNGTYMSNGLTLQGENDIYGAQSQIALGFGQDSRINQTPTFTGGNLLIQRSSPEANLLGPLNARYFGIGDINTNPLALAGLSSRGRGVRINNAQGSTINNPDQYILTGPAPIGWDVEVYQGNSLVSFAKVDTTGIYRFTALPLRAGRNLFRIVMYGPNGEVDEEKKTIYLGQDIPAPGQWQYDTALFQPNQSVIPNPTTTEQGNTLTAQAQLTTGLTKNWAATIGAFRNQGKPLSPEIVPTASTGATAGLRGSFGATYLTGDLFTSGNGNAWQTSVRTPLGEQSDLRLTRSENVGFDARERDELTSTQAQVNIPLPLGFTTLDNAYSFQRDTYQTNLPRNTYSQRTSGGTKGFNLTNKLDYSTQGKSSNLAGSLEASSRLFNTSYRAGVTYQPTSPDLLRQFYLSTQLPVGLEQSLNLTYNQQLTEPRESSLGAGTYWRNGPVSVGVQGQASSNGAMSLGLNLATAFVPQGDGGGWKMASPFSALGHGRIGVRVFVDENSNLHYDNGEPLLPNVRVYHRQRGSLETTDKQGIVRFNGLSVGSLNRFDIDLTSLPDIYLKPVSDTLNVMPHTGDNGLLSYAVRMYGEISGQALTSEGETLNNLKLTLTDAHNNTVDTTYTESDGFYSFGALPMGTYIIKAENGIPVTVTITPKSRIQSTNLLYKKQTF